MSPLRPILVPLDFSASSDGALEIAIALARRLDVEVVLLHVDSGVGTAPLGVEDVERRSRARTELDRSKQALESVSIPVRVLLRPGDPAREILRVARSHSPGLIVLGTHGHSVATAPLLGSVADRVVRYAPFPVLVVPDPARRPAQLIDGPAG